MQAYLCLPNLFPIVNTVRSRNFVVMLLRFVKLVSDSILRLALEHKSKAETRKCFLVPADSFPVAPEAVLTRTHCIKGRPHKNCPSQPAPRP